MDKFSKWIEAHHISKIKSEQAVLFFTDIIHQFGVPNSIITNNNTQFTGRKFLEFLRPSPHPCGLVSSGPSKDKWPSRTCKWHDPIGPKAKNLQPVEQVRQKMAH
jgi:hypothetical protein